MSFEQFWPRYLRAHSDPRTRLVHVAGTVAATGCVAAAAAFLRGTITREYEKIAA